VSIESVKIEWITETIEHHRAEFALADLPESVREVLASNPDDPIYEINLSIDGPAELYGLLPIGEG
jgi:hypothetical protein